MGRTARAVWSAIAAVSVLFTAACGGGDAVDTPTSVGDTVTTTVLREGASEAEKVAVIRLCQQVITSAGVMVRDYNTFIKRLNKVQDYKAIGSEDQWAIETLNTGAELVRKAVAPDVPSDVDDEVQRFVTSSERLAEQIQGKRRDALNRVSKDWSKDRTTLLDTCSEYLPAGGN
ncbi:hypothetical protein [Gordonia phthalatica]|uniref:Lipoprotein n=1 Tax=Gordonia phthalatica TaxID=1136941 RepID=A0A0N9NC83_9ACTN|nr:hypothetical protein [Gordonia phthalatica]ALG85225.1 hypothetical protein ACH46_12995 [Gordonia phthalatica]